MVTLIEVSPLSLSKNTNLLLQQTLTTTTTSAAPAAVTATTPLFDVTNGTKQGCVLALLLFCIFLSVMLLVAALVTSN